MVKSLQVIQQETIGWVFSGLEVKLWKETYQIIDPFSFGGKQFQGSKSPFQETCIAK